MSTAAIAVAALALALALAALARARAARAIAVEAQSDARRRAANAVEALSGQVEVLRSLLARVAAGEPVSAEMVREGMLWRDVGPDEARRLVESGEVEVLDVRTPAETSAGVLPRARLVPIEEMEERWREVPRDRAVLVYCAGGGRSASVCEELARRGYERLLNLEGGIGSWTGPLERSRA